MISYAYGLVVLSYNHPELTSKTLSSALRLNYPASQIILVHNGSESENSDILKSRFPEVEHLILPHNLGFSGGANRGLEKAFTKFVQVLFLTNDIELIRLPSLIPNQYDMGSPTIWKRNSEKIDSVGGELNIQTGTLRHLKEVAQFISSRNPIYAPGTAFTITKACFEKLQGFDESFHTYWEDVDLGIRAQKLGFSIGPVSEIELRHKVGKTCHKDRFYTLYLFQRNRRLLMKKHGWLHLRFRLNYGIDMSRLFFRILFKPQPKNSMRLWWKALND